MGVVEEEAVHRNRIDEGDIVEGDVGNDKERRQASCDVVQRQHRDVLDLEDTNPWLRTLGVGVLGVLVEVPLRRDHGSKVAIV